MLQMEKAPFLLGLIITVLGWHVSQLATQMASTKAVSYSLKVDRRSGDVLAHIKNVSLNRSVHQAEFSLVCADGSRCFRPLNHGSSNGGAIYGQVIPIAPTSPSLAEPDLSDRAVSFTNTIAAGGAFQIRAKLKDPNHNVQFYFMPDQERPVDILVVDRRRITGFIIENHLRIIIVSLFVFIALFLASLAALIASGFKANKGIK